MVSFSKKRNIIVCTSEYITSKEYGGLAIFLEKFFKILKKEYKINLILPSTNDHLKNYDDISIHQININKFYLKLLKKYSTWIFYIVQSFLINKKIKNLIKKDSSIEFIHFSNYQYLGLLYDGNLPTVTRLSSLEDLWNKSTLFSIQKFFEKITLHKTSLILSPSHHLLSVLKNTYGLIGYYLPPLIEKIRIKKIKTNKKIILTFGSISPGKGSIAIQQVINQLLKIDKNIYYFWIGNVDKKFYKSNFHYEQLLKGKTKFKNRIKIIPRMNRKKLFEFINKAQIVILPSLRDNSPNACLESLSLNKITIARKDSGYNDLIKDKFNGFLFNKNKNEAILTLVSKILNLDFVAKAKLKKNINIQNNLFTPNKFILSYNKYIKKII